jgi:CRP-like cAMP-binding protein
MLLSEEGKSILFEHAEKRTVGRNELLLREGQVCRHVHYIHSGLLRTFYNKSGKEINLHFAPETQFTTDLQSLRSGKPSEVNIQSYEPSVIYSFEAARLQELYQRSAEISQWSRALMERLLAEQEAHANLFKILSSAQRYQHLVEHRPDLLQRVSLTQLSSYLGISRESISRIRRG